MADDTNAAIRVSVPILKEKPSASDFTRWRTLARASFTLKGAAKFLSPTKCLELPNTEANVGTDDTKKKAVKQHEWAIAAITIAMQKNDTFLDIIQETVTTDWPGGQMHVIIEKITKEFAPDDDVGDVAKDDALDKISIVKDNEDPQDLFDAIAAVRQLYKGTKSEVTDADMRKQLMKKLPGEYKAAILSEMRYVSKTEKRPATYEELKAAVKGYARLSGIAETTNEVSLVTTDGGKGNTNNNSKKKCYFCKKTGHIKSECKKWKKERGSLYCTHCKTKGHTVEKCWQLHPELNPTKRKRGGRNGGEHANTTIECIFASIDLDLEEEDEEFALFSHDQISHDCHDCGCSHEHTLIDCGTRNELQGTKKKTYAEVVRGTGTDKKGELENHEFDTNKREGCGNNRSETGNHRARMVIRGFQQIDGMHYKSNDKSSPVVCEVTIKVVFVLAMLAGWYMNLVDVESAFLNGNFQNREKMYTEVPKGWRNYYPSWAVLLLLQCCYGTIQAALQWWRECCKALKFIGFERNESEPCLFYKWIDGKLMVFLLWTDDCCFGGPKDLVLTGVEDFMSLWKCKNLGELNEYVGCKVERLKHACRFTQPVKIQRCYDEFGFDKRKAKNRKTPAKPGSVLSVENKEDEPLNKGDQSWYSSLVGMFLHIMRYSRPEITNSIRECSQFMRGATVKCKEQIQRTVEYVLESPERGYTIAPEDRWDGTRNFLFKITGEADSEYAKDPSRRSVNCGCTYLQGCLVKMFSKMMPIVALSTTEAELFAAVLCAQDMVFVYHIVTGLGLTVELPMILYLDNKGAVDLANNWSVGGRTRHMDVKQNYLRELKENGLIQVLHRRGEEITPDIGTKNLPEAPFEYHADKLSTEGELVEKVKEKKKDKPGRINRQWKCVGVKDSVPGVERYS